MSNYQNLMNKMAAERNINKKEEKLNTLLVDAAYCLHKAYAQNDPDQYVNFSRQADVLFSDAAVLQSSIDADKAEFAEQYN